MHMEVRGQLGEIGSFLSTVWFLATKLRFSTMVANAITDESSHAAPHRLLLHLKVPFPTFFVASRNVHVTYRNYAVQ